MANDTTANFNARLAEQVREDQRNAHREFPVKRNIKDNVEIESIDQAVIIQPDGLRYLFRRIE